MKRLLLLIMLLLPLVGAAQQLNYSGFFDRYENDKEFRTVVLGRKMMEMMSEQTSDREMRRTLAGIEHIKVISTSTYNESFVADARAVTSSSSYKLVSSVSEGGREVSFYVLNTREGKNRLLMLSFSDEEWVVMGIYGQFDLRNISRLTQIRPKTK
ncbi:MAG: DUF4252 domain-containing protein [Rikenellaceae bacterium]|nr:DUF4252 domain-containing protein [Rikenellaceae bacterium]MBP3682868.1 DUF4252 domain-containing protein [Rikenellaceae bacterium]